MGGTRRMSGRKIKADQQLAQRLKPRKPRPHGFARARMTSINRVRITCWKTDAGCGTQLSQVAGPSALGTVIDLRTVFRTR